MRVCDYIPGVSISADMSTLPVISATPTPYPLPELPPNTAVDASLTESQLQVFNDLWEVVHTEYLYRDFNGHDWNAIGDQYEALINGGLTEDDFYWAMNIMLMELEDEHSFFESPEEVKASDAQYAGNSDYVGVGIMVSPLPDQNSAVVLFPFPGGPAAEAGVRAHDVILTVDGLTPLSDDGSLNDAVLRGPEGGQATYTLARPGGETFDLTLTRQRIQSALPIDYCFISGTRIAYIFIPGLDDRTVGDQVRAALETFTASGPLDGVVLDNRQNYGGSSTVLIDLLSFFTDGTVGHFVSHADRSPLRIEGEAIGNSQTAPLVVLVDVDTASFGEIMSGVLRNQGRAQIVGQTTPGNVETLWGYDFSDGSRAWIAHETFEPVNQDNAIWETLGIVPDVFVPTRWDLFTEATDPALAKAVELLTK